jgi:ABC-type Fe3+/spermidine/putrescine transport system ATPase subunit
LALRPEKLSFEPAADGAAPGLNQARGKVTDVVFSGNSTTYRIAVGDTVMTLFRQNLTGGAIAPGAEVMLNWSGAHLVAVTP